MVNGGKRGGKEGRRDGRTCFGEFAVDRIAGLIMGFFEKEP